MTVLAAVRPAPPRVTLLLAFACGLIVANLYYAQPLAGPMAASLGMPASAAGLIVTLTQIGYGLGLLFVVPLGDLLENRGLVVGLVLVSALGLAGVALSSHPAPFLAAAALIGVSSAAAQVLVAYASHLAPDATRGRMVGNVMSGLMLGIMLARPVASLVANAASWHAVFFASAVAMVLLAGLLWRALPRRMPAERIRYGALMRSMAQLARGTPVLQRRTLYHTCLFGAFSLFWTTTPLLLAGPRFGLSQGGIALFALAGVAGAVVAPVAGRLADRGWTRVATGAAIAAVAAAFVLTLAGRPGSAVNLAMLVVAAVVLDAGVTMHLVLSQRAIFALGAALRARLNGLFMATFFMGGAAGSAAGGWAWSQGGWGLTCGIGFALPMVALGCYAGEFRGRARRGSLD